MPKAKPEPDPDAIVQLQIRLPAATLERLRKRAFHERRSMAGAARVLIEAGLKRKPPEASP